MGVKPSAGLLFPMQLRDFVISFQIQFVNL
nr:MAG TPA: LYSOSOMAL ALPHA-MANNOSIDASE [Caudoviricetes sp.]